MRITISKFVIALFTISTLHMQAQVTIGLTEAPIEGALLQLKNIDNVTDGSANATKGLLPPRVSLKSPSSLYPLELLDSSTAKQSLVGAMLYNTTENELLCKGLHV